MCKGKDHKESVGILYGCRREEISKRRGWILFEYLLTVILATMTCMLTVQFVSVSCQSTHATVTQLRILEESRFIVMTIHSYLRNATPQSAMGQTNRYRFSLPNGLPHALYGRDRLYLVLRNGQEQPITDTGKGTRQSPRWQMGNGEEETLFLIEESGLVRYRFCYVYGKDTFVSQAAIIPLPLVYRVGEVYEFI